MIDRLPKLFRRAVVLTGPQQRAADGVVFPGSTGRQRRNLFCRLTRQVVPSERGSELLAFTAQYDAAAKFTFRFREHLQGLAARMIYLIRHCHVNMEIGPENRQVQQVRTDALPMIRGQ